jgi:hypothetical protein
LELCHCGSVRQMSGKREREEEEEEEEEERP